MYAKNGGVARGSYKLTSHYQKFQLHRVDRLGLGDREHSKGTKA